MGYKKDFNKKTSAEIFVGADNLFDAKYSLGNDINAAVGRYYNAAPGRNYYAGIIFKLNKS
jgi:iron complex outermembrane receptor protein